ncbi:hypothetical protein CBR_g6623 [Chara braunii]|uniref:Pyrophosphate--fructose 6-phosphate 1-phosphotransferase subunit beta n=1 Tax=Chara braunii TaxID=69332 RepID=A0A388KKB8_CHABU|nr:hypothetical protein CBR_g6623 [Chara braunii]|eukprot:GBG70494.1 hypothetical protein CBR_g6623 [Chara braunii]
MAPASDILSNYSTLQKARLQYETVLPAVLERSFKISYGGPTTSAANSEDIAALFKSMYGQPTAIVEPSESNTLSSAPLKVGVVLSGGQAAGGHNVIAGIFDYLEKNVPGSTLYGFLGGPGGIMKGKYAVITADFLYPYRNQGGLDIIRSGRDKIESDEQMKRAKSTVESLDLDGLVVIGGDDSNTNACVLAEYFKNEGLKTRVIGCPKTIDGDLKSKEVPVSFGFDTACKIFSELIGNVMIDSKSAAKYYHFVRLMGRAASHVTLECALETHPNITLVGEEVVAKKMTLKEVKLYVQDVVVKRAAAGRNYGVVLIPEGLIDFVPEISILIAELNDILAKTTVDKEGEWKKDLTAASRSVFEILPPTIQEQLLLERDPHGNVQVSKIEMEKMLMEMVVADLKVKKDEGTFKGSFNCQNHFFGYEGRCGLPSNFDANYTYALGYTAGALLQSGLTGYMASVNNLTAPMKEWTAGGTPLTSLMQVERRKGKNKPVIRKALVELDGAPFTAFAAVRDDWAINDRFRNPGPIQFEGPAANESNFTLLLEQGVLSAIN